MNPADARMTFAWKIFMDRFIVSELMYEWELKQWRWCPIVRLYPCMPNGDFNVLEFVMVQDPRNPNKNVPLIEERGYKISTKCISALRNKGWNIVKDYTNEDIENIYYHLERRGLVKSVPYPKKSIMLTPAAPHMDNDETLGVE